MMECPLCKGPHSLSQCPRWRWGKQPLQRAAAQRSGYPTGSAQQGPQRPTSPARAA